MADVSLRDYVEALFRERDRAIQSALQAAEKAVNKAEIAADKRFELLNELRAGVATNEEMEALEKLVSTLAARLDRIEAHRVGVSDSGKLLLALLMVVIAAVGLVIGAVV